MSEYRKCIICDTTTDDKLADDFFICPKCWRILMDCDLVCAQYPLATHARKQEIREYVRKCLFEYKELVRKENEKKEK